MKHWKICLVILALSLSPGGFAQEEASEEILELQTKAFIALEQGKEMVDAGELESAVSAYRRALAIYRGMRQKDPNFKKDTLDWRISLCGNQIAELTARIQQENPNPAAVQKSPDGLPPPPPFNPTPIGGNQLPPEATTVAQPPVQPKPAPLRVTDPEPAPRPRSPELQAEAADLEYMSKYIALLEEVKELKKEMVAVHTREETSNVTIRRLSKQVEELSTRREDMMKTIQKVNTRNQDLLDGLDEAKTKHSKSEEAKAGLETELAKVKASLETAEENLSVMETKLQSLETEFQENKKRIASNNRKVGKMETERDLETERANNLAVDVAKLKSNLTRQQAEADDKVKELEDQLALKKSDQDTELKESKKSLATARKRNTELLSDYELAQAEVESLKEAMEHMKQADTNDVEGMRAELEGLHKEKESLQAMLAEKDEQLANVDDDLKRLEELDIQYASATNEIAHLKKEVADRDQRLVDASAGDEGMQKQVKILIAEKADLSTELEDLKDSHALMTVDLSSKRGDLEAALAERSKALVRIKDLQLSIAKTRQEKGTVDSRLKQVEQVLADTQAALTDAGKSADGWLKDKTEMERMHAAVLADQEKALQSVRSELREAQDDIDDWKLKTADAENALSDARTALATAEKNAGGWLKEKTAMERKHAGALANQDKTLQSVRDDLREANEESDDWKSKSEEALVALKAEKKALADLQKSSGSSGRTIAGLQKSLADLQEDLKRRETELAKAKGVLAESDQAFKTQKSEYERVVRALEQATSENEKAASTLARERDAALKQLQAKDAEISELKKKGSGSESQPMRRRSARMNDIVPVPLLEQLGQMTPMVNIRSKGETGFAVEYPGVGTINLVLPE